MKVAIITPTIRKDGLDIVKKSIDSQSYPDIDWFVGSSFQPVSEAKWVKDEFQGGFWSLNRIYNELFRAASSADIIVTWQDWIWARPDAIARFVEDIKSTGGIISGVGDQYERVNKWGKPEVKIWSDPRKTTAHGDFYECYPNDIEWNFAAFPTSAIFSVGGMDEELDFLGFGGDQLQVGERFDALGYKSYLDQTIESFTVRHDRSDFGGQQKWDDNHVLFNGQYDKRKVELVNSGKWPILDYLKDGRKTN